jgi:hypothetical protein
MVNRTAIKVQLSQLLELLFLDRLMYYIDIYRDRTRLYPTNIITIISINIFVSVKQKNDLC